MRNKFSLSLLLLGSVIAMPAFAFEWLPSSCDGLNVHIYNKSSAAVRVKAINTDVDNEQHASSIDLNIGEVIGSNQERVVTVHSAPKTHGNVAGNITLTSMSDSKHEIYLTYKGVQWFPWYCNINDPVISGTSPYHFLVAQQFNNQDIEFDIYGY